MNPQTQIFQQTRCKKQKLGKFAVMEIFSPHCHGGVQHKDDNLNRSGTFIGRRLHECFVLLYKMTIQTVWTPATSSAIHCTRRLLYTRAHTLTRMQNTAEYLVSPLLGERHSYTCKIWQWCPPKKSQIKLNPCGRPVWHQPFISFQQKKVNKNCSKSFVSIIH